MIFLYLEKSEDVYLKKEEMEKIGEIQEWKKQLKLLTKETECETNVRHHNKDDLKYVDRI